MDPYTPAKYETLKRYALKYNVKWAFVRDVNEELFYLNSGNWLDTIENNNWKPIRNLFE